MQQYRDGIAKHVKDIEIAMLFLNVGVMKLGRVAKITDEDMQSTINCSVLGSTYTVKALMDQILAREHKSALIITTSGLGMYPAPGNLTYSCSKSFSNFLALGLHHEFEGKVDTLSWTCGPCETGLTGYKANAMVASVDEAVDGVLKQIGNERISSGCSKHAWREVRLSFKSQLDISSMFYNIYGKK